MPNAYLVEIHTFLVENQKRARRGMAAADTAEETAYYRGMFDEVTHMARLVSEKYNMNFHDYGEAV